MVKVFAPVNIAWIKYMGKSRGLPTNASLSVTLDQIGTTTTIKKIQSDGKLEFKWSALGYLPPEHGREKAEAFLKNSEIWKEGMESLQLPYVDLKGTYEIETHNNVPAGTGIATSASGFAALTLAWFGMLQERRFLNWKFRYEHDLSTKRVLADIARHGSGSACRSFEGPFVEWDLRTGTHVAETGTARFTDFVLIFETNVKDVSSSEAHLRVASSPRFQGRAERAETRLHEVKRALIQDDLKTLQRVVLEEAIDMHELFHTSHPAFTYLKPESRDWIGRVKEQNPNLTTPHAILTLDAGANCHLFVPENEEDIWEHYLSQGEVRVPYLKARSGKGAYYVDESF